MGRGSRDRIIRVRVEDANSRPIEDARLRLVLSGNGAPVGEEYTSTSLEVPGLIETDPRPYGPYFVDIEAPGYARVRVGVYERDLSDKDDRTVVVLAPADTVRVHAVDAEGRPATGCRVECLYSPPRPHHMMGNCWNLGFVPGDGSGLVCEVPRGQEFRIRVEAPDGRTRSAAFRDIAEAVVVMGGDD